MILGQIKLLIALVSSGGNGIVISLTNLCQLIAHGLWSVTDSIPLKKCAHFSGSDVGYWKLDVATE